MVPNLTTHMNGFYTALHLGLQRCASLSILEPERPCPSQTFSCSQSNRLIHVSRSLPDLGRTPRPKVRAPPSALNCNDTLRWMNQALKVIRAAKRLLWHVHTSGKTRVPRCPPSPAAPYRVETTAAILMPSEKWQAFTSRQTRELAMAMAVLAVRAPSRNVSTLYEAVGEEDIEAP